MVILSLKNERIFSWPLAIVDDVFPDEQGDVPNVLIRLADGSVRKTSVQNLVFLPVNVD